MNGGRFDFDDGGTYCGGWEEGKAHGHGVCTGPKSQGEYSGAWHYGFEVSGVYIWPSGNTFEGQWQNGKRHGLGVERRGRWVYRGEWTQGFKGRYGLRQSTHSKAKYEGTWAAGLQDGYGTETYADGGTYNGQWLRGMRHGYGIRKSVPYGLASKFRSRSHAHSSLSSLRSEQGDEVSASGTGMASREGSAGPEAKDRGRVEELCRGGFVLRARSEPPSRRRSLSERSVAVKRTILQGLRIKKQRSTGDINQRVNAVVGTGSLRSSGSTASCASDESAFYGSHQDTGPPPEEISDPTVVECYSGEWKNDKRSGFGVSERSDGLRYEGEWFNNRKYGYGVTTQRDGTREEGKYKNNVLITSQRKKHLLFVRSSKLRERIDAAVAGAHRANQIAIQKADIAGSRTATARDRAEQADMAALQARDDSEVARVHAKQYAPDFRSQGLEYLRRREEYHQPHHYMSNHIEPGGSDTHDLSSMANNVRALPSNRSKSNYVNHPQSAGIGSPIPSNSTATSSSLEPQLETPMSDFKPIQTAVEAPPGATFIDPYASNVGQRHRPYLQHNQLPTSAQTSDYSRGPGYAPYEHARGVSSPLKAQRNRLPADDYQQQPSAFSDASNPQTSYYAPQSALTQPQAELIRTAATASMPPASSTMQSNPQAMSSSFTPYDIQQQQQPMIQHQRVAQLQGAGRDYASAPGGYSPEPQIAARVTGYYDDETQFHETYATVQHPSDFRTTSGGSPTTSHASLNQLMINDHHDQYGGTRVPRHRVAQGGGRVPSALSNYSDSDALAAANRRASLATAADKKALAAYGLGSAKEAGDVGMGNNIGGKLRQRPGGLSPIDGQGSVPDLTELDRSPVNMTREEIARLGSHRRQEILRNREEQELLRANPLRYAFHPAVKEWISKQKLAVLVVFVNLTLALLFYNLLTYSSAKPDNDAADS